MTRNTTNHGWPAPEVEDPGSEYVAAFDTLIDALDVEVILKGPLGDRPAAGNDGRWYLSTDDDDRYLYYDTGDDWVSVAGADPTRLDGGDGQAGDVLVSDGADVSWDSGPGSGIDSDTVDGLGDAEIGEIGAEETITETWLFDLGLALGNESLRFRGRSDDEWAAAYTGSPPAPVERATNEAIVAGVWSSGSENTGWVFADQLDNIGAEIIPESGIVYAHGNVYANGNRVAELEAGQTITGLWEFDNAMQLLDQGADPGSVGRIRRNGDDVKVYSGNGVVNLSDIATIFSGSHDDLVNVSSDDHHVKYTNAEAIGAINNDADHGSTASHNYYTDGEARTAVEGDVDAADLVSGTATDGQVPTADGAGAIAWESPAAGPTTVADGTIQLSSGSAVVSTGVTTTGTRIDVYLDPSGGGANSTDVKAAARAFWDDSDGEYKVEILEDGTSVGNPTIGYEVLSR